MFLRPRASGPSRCRRSQKGRGSYRSRLARISRRTMVPAFSSFNCSRRRQTGRLNAKSVRSHSDRGDLLASSFTSLASSAQLENRISVSDFQILDASVIYRLAPPNKHPAMTRQPGQTRRLRRIFIFRQKLCPSLRYPGPQQYRVESLQIKKPADSRHAGHVVSFQNDGLFTSYHTTSLTRMKFRSGSVTVTSRLSREYRFCTFCTSAFSASYTG